MYRRRGRSWEVLLVHPERRFWAKKDEGAWTIPKGEIEEGEDAFAAALREFNEETGLKPAGEFRPLSPVRLKSRKTVRAWAFENRLGPVRAHELALHRGMASSFRQDPGVPRGGRCSMVQPGGGKKKDTGRPDRVH